MATVKKLREDPKVAGRIAHSNPQAAVKPQPIVSLKITESWA